MMFFGAESGSDAVLKRMSKQLGTDEILECARRCRSHGDRARVLVRAAATRVDPERDVEESLAFMHRLKAVSPRSEILIFVYTPVPQPGALFEQSTREGLPLPGHARGVGGAELGALHVDEGPADAVAVAASCSERILDFELVIKSRFPTETDIRFTAPFRARAEGALLLALEHAPLRPSPGAARAAPPGEAAQPGAAGLRRPARAEAPATEASHLHEQRQRRHGATEAQSVRTDVREVFSAAASAYGRGNPLLFIERDETPRLLPRLEGRDVLDLGCGQGHYAALAAHAGRAALDRPRLRAAPWPWRRRARPSSADAGRTAAARRVAWTWWWPRCCSRSCPTGPRCWARSTRVLRAGRRAGRFGPAPGGHRARLAAQLRRRERPHARDRRPAAVDRRSAGRGGPGRTGHRGVERAGGRRAPSAGVRARRSPRLSDAARNAAAGAWQRRSRGTSHGQGRPLLPVLLLGRGGAAAGPHPPGRAARGARATRSASSTPPSPPTAWQSVLRRVRGRGLRWASAW